MHTYSNPVIGRVASTRRVVLLPSEKGGELFPPPQKIFLFDLHNFTKEGKENTV